MIYFKHCRECKPPKRYPGCSGVCEDYKRDRERYDADMAKNPDRTAASGYFAEKCATTKDSITKYKRDMQGRLNHGGSSN